MKGREILEVIITHRLGTRHTLIIVIDHDKNSINVDASGELTGDNIYTFINAVQQAANQIAGAKKVKSRKNENYD